jgi:hypothetical protein
MKGARVKYGDLIQFDPIEDVIQIKDADKVDVARQLVSNFVISDDMAAKLSDPHLPGAVFRNLQFDEPQDNKGVLIIGNYGTGKSHLMSVISAVAEHGELADVLTSRELAESAKSIAGKFKVLRREIGATTMGLRDIITLWLEEGLAELGITFKFPDQDKVPSNKPALTQMMAAFGEMYPDHGLLLVVDEMLDYLRSRRDQQLVLDLGFMREVGEICKDTRFRMIGGLQEAIFDSPQFKFVSDSLSRVQSRFSQLLIAREDVEYVVAQRLLKKSDEQRERIRTHLQPFTRFYGDMNERMDDFVRLFPVHPEYIKVFEQIRAVEKREVLRTLSASMKRMLDVDVPADAPGLIAFDSYWKTIEDNPQYRTYPDVKKVIDVGDRLEGLVDVGYPAGQNKAFAHRIISGLCVHRLAVGDIEKPIGLTAEALRDQLCLYDPLVAELGGEPADDLRGAVETALRLISTTVNGQFISATERDAKGKLGGQFFLDVSKDVDYDQLVQQRAVMIDDDARNRYYYEALKLVMECTDQPYVGGYRIWERELEWREHRTMRKGYLFFGAPNERSTAVPQRDFYVYFLEPFEVAQFKDEKRSDEVFFRLVTSDDDFRSLCTFYAAALDLAATSAGQAKNVYEAKAQGFHRDLVQWLKANLASFEVTHEGKTRSLLEWAKTMEQSPAAYGSSLSNIRDAVNYVASGRLAGHFAEQAPEYPTFSVLITAANRAQAAQDALRWMRGAGRSQEHPVAVLDALELLHDGKVRPADSRYARYISDQLAKKGEGQVLNRSEIISDDHGVPFMDPSRYRLEPEFVAVLVGALANNGDLTVSLSGQKYDATNMDTLVVKPIDEIADFKHVQRPQGWQLPSIRALFELVDLPSGLVAAVQEGKDEPIQQLQTEAIKLAGRLATAASQVANGIILFDGDLLGESEKTEMVSAMNATKSFLDSVQAYKTPGQMKNFAVPESEIATKHEGLSALFRVEALETAVLELNPLAAYLTQARMVSTPDDPWVADADEVMSECTARITAVAGHLDSVERRNIQKRLADCKERYIAGYLELHKRARLDQSQDQRKAKLLNDSRLKMLDALATIELLPIAQLRETKERLAGIKSCWSLMKVDLEKAPTCQACHFRPDVEPAAVPLAGEVEAIDVRLDELVAQWTTNLVANLEDPLAWNSISLLDEPKKKAVEKFLHDKQLPQPVPSDLVSGLQEVLAGLEKLVITAADVRAALQEGGTPAKPEDLKARFGAYLDKRLAGKDRDRVRVVIE